MPQKCVYALKNTSGIEIKAFISFLNISTQLYALVCENAPAGWYMDAANALGVTDNTEERASTT